MNNKTRQIPLLSRAVLGVKPGAVLISTPEDGQIRALSPELANELADLLHAAANEAVTLQAYQAAHELQTNLLQ